MLNIYAFKAKNAQYIYDKWEHVNSLLQYKLITLKMKAPIYIFLIFLIFLIWNFLIKIGEKTLFSIGNCADKHKKLWPLEKSVLIIGHNVGNQKAINVNKNHHLKVRKKPF